MDWLTSAWPPVANAGTTTHLEDSHQADSLDSIHFGWASSPGRRTSDFVFGDISLLLVTEREEMNHGRESTGWNSHHHCGRDERQREAGSRQIPAEFP